MWKCVEMDAAFSVYHCVHINYNPLISNYNTESFLVLGAQSQLGGIIVLQKGTSNP